MSEKGWPDGSVALSVAVVGHARPGEVLEPQSAFGGFWLPREVIVVAVCLHLRYNISYGDVEELLIGRGVEVDYVTVFRWVQGFTPLLAETARFCRHAPGDRWFVDETCPKAHGVWRYLYRAVDQDGQVIDVLISTRRDAAAARRCFRLLRLRLHLTVAAAPRPRHLRPDGTMLGAGKHPGHTHV